MGILDSITQGSQAVADKLKNVSDTATTSASISREKDALTNYYRMLGEKYYKLKGDAPDAELSEICSYIKQSHFNIKSLEDSLNTLKGIIRCPSCGAECPQDKNFCHSCGTKIAKEEPAAEKKPIFCINCGAKNSDDSLFCINCGTKIN